MEKFLPSFLLAVSASTSLLLAQSGTRLKATDQVTGCRLQVVGSNQETDCREQLTDTNQVIGCMLKNRLEVIGYRLEEEDQKLQTTDCREQLTDNRTVELLLENQIGRQADATTNYELPTTNCDNALRCHLTMNPEEISEAENAFGFSERKTARLKIPMETTTEIDSTIEGSACSTSSPFPSSISYLPSPTAAAVPTAYSLQPIASIRPAGRLGDYILSLPAEMIAQFLRSPEPKQAAYKAEHEQTVQELQAQYPCLTCPELAQKIVDWKRAVERWSECRFPEEQEACYQNVVALASEMSPELYRLVALSQAMKIMEDAKAYSYYLPRAFEQYDKDTETEEARTMATRSKIILLAQIDAINNNIEKLEKAAEAILTLAEKRNRCLVKATAETAMGRGYRAKEFQTAARMAEESIISYCEFSQKMREGDVPAAFLLRIKGFSLECNILRQEYFIQVVTSEDSIKKEDFSEAESNMFDAIDLLTKITQAESPRQVETAKAYEQASRYCCQEAEASANGDRIKAKNFARAVRRVICASGAFQNTAQYYFQAAEAAANGDRKKEDDFVNKASGIVYTPELLQVRAQVALDQSTNEKHRCERGLKSFYGYNAKLVYKRSAGRFEDAARILKKTIEAQEKGQNDIALFLKQSAERLQISADNYWEEAEAYLAKRQQEGFQWHQAAEINCSSAGSLAAVANSLKKAIEAQEKGQSEVACLFQQSAEQYQLAADNYKKQAEVIIANREEGSLHWKEFTEVWKKSAEANYTSAHQLWESANSLKKSIEAQEKELEKVPGFIEKD
ncbi:MAG TPA: hypothetical protein VJK54_02705 [Chthoniobacterales bacterium]|nr:hypothetical protein [Chthoniobacterales bacterium]